MDTTQRIRGFTHSFYRYPATTSPEIVRAILLKFSEPGDYVLDPFMGGGTSIVESLAHGRRAIGFDLNALAVFVSRAKTTPMTVSDWHQMKQWVLTSPFEHPSEFRPDKRAANLPNEVTACLSNALDSLKVITRYRSRFLARMAILRTAQWCMETRESCPSNAELQGKLKAVVEQFESGMTSFLASAKTFGLPPSRMVQNRLLVSASAEEAAQVPKLEHARGKIKLVITSPPYPGVHVLYHRWQVNSRRETPAPYWVIGRRDGNGPSYYTMGGRSQIGQVHYFERAEIIFSGIKNVLAKNAVVAQLVAFNDSETQLPIYCAMMDRAGYESIQPDNVTGHELVRQVPNRRWYVRNRQLDGSKEYLLLHRAG